MPSRLSGEVHWLYFYYNIKFNLDNICLFSHGKMHSCSRKLMVKGKRMKKQKDCHFSHLSTKQA